MHDVVFWLYLVLFGAGLLLAGRYILYLVAYVVYGDRWSLEDKVLMRPSRRTVRRFIQG